MTFALRPYQVETIRAIDTAMARGETDILAVLATGAGKTQIFLQWLIGHLADGGRGLIIAHRQELISQPLERLEQFWPAWSLRTGIVMAERNECDRPLTIATVQTLASAARLQQLLAHGPINYVVIDEAHHACAQSYRDVITALRTANPQLIHLGVTATPLRGDGDGLAKIYTHVAAKYGIKELIETGYLVPLKCLGISLGLSSKGIRTQSGDWAPRDLADAIKNGGANELVVQSHQQYATDRKAIAFLPTVDAAYSLADAFNAAGIRAAAADGTTDKAERRELLKAFRAGAYDVLCNCGLWTEGLDLPEISCIHQVRPTQADGLYLQMVGRGLRLSPGKDDCLVLDYLFKETRNITMAGDVLGVPQVMRPKDKADAERGEIITQFSFDTHGLRTDGTPLEIIARELDYLQVSPFAWDRRDGWLILGLGQASDGAERMLVIQPMDTDGVQRLYGLYRPERDPHWRSYLLQESDDFAALSDQAHAFADKWGNGALAAKSRGWHALPPSENQLRYLTRLAGGRAALEKLAGKKATVLSRGEAAKLITFYQAQQTLRREGVWQ